MAVLLVPGEGRTREPNPVAEHNEYPKHMVHPGFKPGVVGQKVVSEHGFSYHVGGEAIRFAPVLVTDESQEAYHASQGYQSIGKSDPAAFARAVAAAQPVSATYVAQEYPKWVGGVLVKDAEEEAEQAGGKPKEASSEPLIDEPATNADGASEEDEIAALEAKLAALKAKIGTPVTHDEAVAHLKDVISEETVQEIVTEMAQDPPQEMTRSEKIKATLARKKAEKEAAAKAKALQDEVQAE